MDLRKFPPSCIVMSELSALDWPVVPPFPPLLPSLPLPLSLLHPAVAIVNAPIALDLINRRLALLRLSCFYIQRPLALPTIP